MSISLKLLSILAFEINFVWFGFIAVFSPCASQYPPPPDVTHKLCEKRLIRKFFDSQTDHSSFSSFFFLLPQHRR